MFKNLSKFIGLLTLLTVTSILFGSGKAHAATIDASGSCSLSDAIISVNGAANSGACTSTGVYGTGDTINLPAGTITLTTGLPQITTASNLTISGASRSETIIDAGGFRAISTTSQSTANRIFENFTVRNSDLKGIDVDRSNVVIVRNIEVDNSKGGVRLNGMNVSVTGSYIHNNTSSETLDRVGLEIYLHPVGVSDDPSATIQDSKISANTGLQLAGVYVEVDSQAAASLALTLQRTSVSGNSSKSVSGVQIAYQDNTTLTDLKIDAVTVADNVVIPTVAGDSNIFGPAYISGFFLGLSNLKPQLNLTNVTVANNRVTNTVDNHVSIAGFFGLLINPPEKINLTNTTVVGNSVTQSTLSPVGKFAAFFLIAPTLVDGNPQPTSVNPAGSTQNSLIAGNSFNGENSSCQPALIGSVFGLSGTYDLTPQNLGSNMSDDQKCTGFLYEPTLYDTIDHQVADNGGPVPTIKLLPGSPAINAGGQVLGISTDARGVVRSGYYSVGAYQGVLAADTASPTSSSGGITLAKTGVMAISTIVLLGLILFALIFAYVDYRRHKKPLTQADPKVQYSFGHHLRVVSFPLCKYRLSITFAKKKYSIDGVHKF